MPINPDDIDALPSYTTAQRLKMYRKAEMDILAAGQSYSVAERQKANAQLAEIRQAIKELEAEVGAETPNGTDAGGIAVARFGNPQ